MFHKVERSTTGEAIRNQVLAAIAAGTLKPGQRVPTERELTELFQVSRPALREGLKALVFTGILEQRGSRGTFVAESLNDSILNASIRLVPVRQAREAIEIIEARRGIECELARLAAARRTDEDLAAMRRILDLLAACPDESPERAVLDFEFHSALGAAAHSGILHSLQMSFGQKILAVMRKAIYRPEASKQGHREHVGIFAAVRDGRAETAARIMNKHLVKLEDGVRYHMEGPSAPDPSALDPSADPGREEPYG